MEGDNTTNEIILYKECLRNHAASLGSYAIDGCGEFSLLLDPNHISPPPTLLCAACGCHRNFHRRITSQEPSFNPDTYNNNAGVIPEPSRESGGMMIGYKKRCRTKFTEEQKEKMLDFAEKLGWRMKRREKDDDDDDEVEGFCKRVGLTRKVFKVWMHNHKNSLSTTTTPAENATSSSTQEQ